MRLIKLIFTVWVYFSVATVLAQLAILGVVWSKGRFTKDDWIRLLAVAHDVDLNSMWLEMEEAARPIMASQVSYDEITSARKNESLDLDLREIATDKGLGDIRQLQTVLDRERTSYEELKDDFEQRLEQLHQGVADQSLLDLQHQLESTSPKRAKDQLLRILDSEAIDSDTALFFVVTVVKGMQLDKRKRILSEFKDEDEERLHEILEQIRLGMPDVELIRQTRSQLEQFKPRH